MNVLIPPAKLGRLEEDVAGVRKRLLCYSWNGVASQTTQTQEASMDNNSLSHCK